MGKSKSFEVKQTEWMIGTAYIHLSIELTAHQRFTRSSLRILGGNGFHSAFEAIRANSATDFCLYEIVVDHGVIVLCYANSISGEKGRIIPKKIPGLRLEFEATTEYGPKRHYVLEYDRDRFLGKLLRIRMREEDQDERCATMLEDGHIILEDRYTAEYVSMLRRYDLFIE